MCFGFGVAVRVAVTTTRTVAFFGLGVGVDVTTTDWVRGVGDACVADVEVGAGEELDVPHPATPMASSIGNRARRRVNQPPSFASVAFILLLRISTL